MDRTNQTPLQWHPAFYAGIQIEYKSPSDYLSIDDFYHVYAYACFYKSDANRVDEILAEEITISFVVSKYPRKVISHLKTKRNYDVKYIESGIYYIVGDIFPIQIICTRELQKESNFWLHNLTDHIKTKEEALKIMQRYEVHNNEKLYESVVNVIVMANRTAFKEVTGMCKALEELYEEVLGEKYEKILAEKDAYIAKKEASIAERDAILAERDAILAERDVILAEKDAYIRELEERLAMQTA